MLCAAGAGIRTRLLQVVDSGSFLRLGIVIDVGIVVVVGVVAGVVVGVGGTNKQQE